MKGVLSLFLIFVLVMVAAHCSSSHIGRINKRYYDTWEANSNEGGAVSALPHRHKDDPCENKPLWFLKSQRKLGKLSPFYDCLNGLE